MRIAVWHNLPSGGGKRALYHQVKGLIERGHTVESWCLSTSDRSYLPLRDFGPERVVPLSASPAVRRSRFLDWLAMVPDVAAIMRAADQASRECAREISEGQFDVLFANTCWLSATPFVARHVQLPTVLYLQEPVRRLHEARPVLPWIGTARHDAGSLLYRILRFLAHTWPVTAYRLQAWEEWRNAQAYDTILVNSHFSRESVLRIYGRDAKVCYLGVDTELFQDQHRDRERFVVGLGAFDRSKGIDLAIQAVSLLDEAKPPLVWIANLTDPAYVQEMMQLAGLVGVDLRVRTRVSDGELVDTLNRATLMVYTSCLEPFGLAPLEANACATPVVAVAEGGVRETVKDGETGLLVDREPERVAEGMRRLFDDHAFARRLGETGRQHVQRNWSWKDSVDRLEAHLNRAAAGRFGRSASLRSAPLTRAGPKGASDLDRVGVGTSREPSSPPRK